MLTCPFYILDIFHQILHFLRDRMSISIKKNFPKNQESLYERKN